MNQLTRRNFIKQLALIPAAAALPALPELEPSKVLHLTASLDTATFTEAVSKYTEGIRLMEQRHGLLKLAPALIGPSRGFCDGMITGLEAGIDDLIASTQHVFQAMIEQIEVGGNEPTQQHH